MHVSNLGRRLTDEKEMQCLFDWLVGDEVADRPTETDLYGIVAFDPKIDLVSTQDRMALLELQVSDDPTEAARAKDELAKLQMDTAQRIKATRFEVRQRADKRVRRAMRTIHNNLIRQWQINEEQKLGKYPPSITEMLGARVLNDEIEKAAAKGAKIKENMNKLMNRQAV